MDLKRAQPDLLGPVVVEVSGLRSPGEAVADLLRTRDPTDAGTGPKVLWPSRTVKYGGDNRKDRFFKKLREIFGILRGLFDRNGQQRL